MDARCEVMTKFLNVHLLTTVTEMRESTCPVEGERLAARCDGTQMAIECRRILWCGQFCFVPRKPSQNDYLKWELQYSSLCYNAKLFYFWGSYCRCSHSSLHTWYFCSKPQAPRCELSVGWTPALRCKACRSQFVLHLNSVPRVPMATIWSERHAIHSWWNWNPVASFCIIHLYNCTLTQVNTNRPR